MQPRWLIVGADGGIGSALATRLPDSIRTSRRAGTDNAVSLDLAADPDSWDVPHAEIAVLCAAVTSIETCRMKPAETRSVNVERTVQLAKRLAARGTFPVFLSTNQVFDGSKPFRGVDEKPCPLTEYGRQKAEAERAILTLNGAVIRLTKVLAAAPPLFNTWADSLRSGMPIEPYSDLVFAPVPMAAAVEAIVATGSRREPGIVQVSGERDVSYAEAATRLAARLGADSSLVRPVTFASRGIAPEAAPRNTTLDTATLAPLNVTLPPVWETIEGLFP